MNPRSILVLFALALAGCSTGSTNFEYLDNDTTEPWPAPIEATRIVSLGASYQSLEADDTELGGASGQVSVSQVFDNGLEVGGTVSFSRWELNGDDTTLIKPELFTNYNLALSDSIWLYAGPHAGWAHFNEAETDDGFSYGAHAGIRFWAAEDDSIMLFVEPRWSRFELFDETVDDVQVLVGLGFRF